MTEKEQRHPSFYSPDLKQEYLEDLCKEVLDVVNQAISDSSTNNDTAWTRGTLPYGRVQGLFIALHNDQSRPWFTLANATMDYTAKIGNTFIQVVTDNPDQPKKNHRLKANSIELRQWGLELEQSTKGADVLTWRLFIDKDDNDEIPTLHASLVGFDSNTNPLCIWHYGDIVVTPVRAKEFISEVNIEDVLLRRKINEDENSDQVDEDGK